MAITTPNFASTESLSSPSIVTFTDDSTGSDAGLTSRRIYIELADGTWLTTSGISTTVAYTLWPIAQTSINLDILSSSTAASVTVDWMTNSTATYTKTQACEWILYDVLFLFELLSSQTSNPAIIADTDYYSNFLNMIVNLYASEIAIEDMDDIYSAQSSLDRNQNYINNQSLYF